MTVAAMRVLHTFLLYSAEAVLLFGMPEGAEVCLLLATLGECVVEEALPVLEACLVLEGLLVHFEFPHFGDQVPQLLDELEVEHRNEGDPLPADLLELAGQLELRVGDPAQHQQHVLDAAVQDAVLLLGDLRVGFLGEVAPVLQVLGREG